MLIVNSLQDKAEAAITYGHGWMYFLTSTRYERAMHFCTSRRTIYWNTMEDKINMPDLENPWTRNQIFLFFPWMHSLRYWEREQAANGGIAPSYLVVTGIFFWYEVERSRLLRTNIGRSKRKATVVLSRLSAWVNRLLSLLCTHSNSPFVAIPQDDSESMKRQKATLFLWRRWPRGVSMVWSTLYNITWMLPINFDEVEIFKRISTRPPLVFLVENADHQTCSSSGQTCMNSSTYLLQLFLTLPMRSFKC